MPKPKTVILTSEKPNPEDMRIAKKAFDCRMFTFYGQTERVVLAGECEESDSYHVFPEYGVTEIVSPDGAPILSPGETGSIVGTGFVNDILPLIRFDTGDLSAWLDVDCSCGRSYPTIAHVDGRSSESFLISKNKRLVSAAALNPHAGFLDKLRMFQFVQEKEGEVVLLLVPTRRFNSEDEDLIRVFFKERLGTEFNFMTKIVDNIPPTKMGKRNVIQQHLKISHYL